MNKEFENRCHLHEERLEGITDISAFVRFYGIKRIKEVATKWGIPYNKCVGILHDCKTWRNFYEMATAPQILGKEYDRQYRNDRQTPRILHNMIELMECVENDNNNWVLADDFDDMKNVLRQ